MAPDKDDKPEIEKNGDKFPEALKGLIEQPPLLEGENPDDFWNFFQAVVDDQKPQGIMDWIAASDMTIKYWEELRLRRSSAALIRGGVRKALTHFFMTIKPMRLDLELAEPSKDLALKYFSKDTKEREEIVALLAQHGITLPELQAKAAELSREPLQMFERMIAARENGRRQLRKEAALAKRQTGGSNPGALE